MSIFKKIFIKIEWSQLEGRAYTKSHARARYGRRNFGTEPGAVLEEHLRKSQTWRGYGRKKTWKKK
jgi:hypothetical protein